MAEKLQSITSRIPWSSLLKAAVAASFWYAASWWIFALVACMLYFVPIFAPGSTALYLAVFAWLSYVLPSGVSAGEAGAAGALVLGILFFITLGVKDLVFIDRARAKELFLLLFLFAALVRFFAVLEGGDGALPIASLVIGALLMLLLLRNLLRDEEARVVTLEPAAPATRAGFAAGLATLLTFELAVIATFLPMNFFYNAALTFAGAAALVEYFVDDARLSASLSGGRAARSQTFFYFAAFFIVFVFVLVSNSWRP